MRIAYAMTALFTVAAAGCYDPGDLGDTPFKCSATFPDCPDGYTCNLTVQENINRCVRNDAPPPPPLAIKKQGVYVGAHTDPGLNASNCPDRIGASPTEPNDTIAQATKNFDGGGPNNNLAICPVGDIDVFEIDLAAQYVKVAVQYQIAMGDLAVGIFDANGTLLASDPNYTNNNACVVYSKSTTGTLYAGVLGALNSMNTTDQNRYVITITKDNNPLNCGTQPPPADMSMPPDMAFQF